MQKVKKFEKFAVVQKVKKLKNICSAKNKEIGNKEIWKICSGAKSKEK